LFVKLLPLSWLRIITNERILSIWMRWVGLAKAFHSTDFCEVIIPCLTSVVFPDRDRQRKQRVDVHMDNDRSHNSKRSVQRINDNNFKKIPYAPYSPDIALSDFYLFDTVKQRLQPCQDRSFKILG
jgi:transcriptional regulator of met regulon